MNPGVRKQASYSSGAEMPRHASRPPTHSAWLPRKAEQQALGDACRLGAKRTGPRWLEPLVTRLAKEGEPAVEQARGQATEAHVDSEWGALVATAGQHDRRPEIPQGGQMT